MMNENSVVGHLCPRCVVRSARSGIWRFEFAKRAARLFGRYRWAQNAWLGRQHELRFGSTEVKLRVPRERSESYAG